MTCVKCCEVYLLGACTVLLSGDGTSQHGRIGLNWVFTGALR